MSRLRRYRMLSPAATSCTKYSYLLALMAAVLFSVIRAQDPLTLFTPEKIRLFADHLYSSRDYLRAAMEYERYLFLAGGEDDSVQFRIGLCHQFRGRHDLAAQVFGGLVEPNTSRLASAARLAHLHNLKETVNWSSILRTDYPGEDPFYYYYMARVSEDPRPVEEGYFDQVESDTLRARYLELEQERLQLRPKRPLTAAALSALVPGLGKFYLHRPGDGLYALGMSLLMGYTAYNAFEHDRAIAGLFTTGLGILFYSGTVYGSHVGADIYNAERWEHWKDHLRSLDPVRKRPYW